MAEAEQVSVELPSEEIDLPSVGDPEYGATNTNQKTIAVKDSVTPFMEDPEILLNKLEASQNKSVELIQEEGRDEYLQKIRSLDAEILSTATDMTPEQSLSLAAKVQADQVKSLSESPTYLSIKNNILATPGSEKLTPSDVENLASDTLLLYGLGKMLDDKSTISKAYDIAGMMLVTDFAWNTSDAIASIKEEFQIEEVSGDYLDSFQDMITLGKYRRELNEEDRLRFDKRLGEIYDEIDDNELQKAHFFEALLGRNEYLELEDLMDKGGAAATIAQFGPAVFMRILRTAQMVKRLGEVGDKQGAMKAADMATASEETAQLMGQSQVDAAHTGNPLKDIFAGAPKDASTEYRHHARKIDDALARLDNVATIDIAAHTPEEQVRIAASIRKNLPEDLEMDAVEVKFIDGQPVINYNLLDESGEVIEEVSRPYVLDDVGSFVDEDVGLGSNVLRPIVSPKFVQGTDAKQLVDKAMVGTYAKAKLGADYTEAAEVAFKPIKHNRGSVARVDKMLQMLDGKDIVPTYQTLVNEGVGGLKLTDKEFQAYTGIRRVLDDMHYRNDKVLRQEMDLMGTRSVTIDGDMVFAKPYDDAKAAEAAFHNDPDSITVFQNGAEIKGVSLGTLEDAYKEGYVLVKSHSDSFDDWFTIGQGKDAQHFRFGLVKKESVGGLPPTVLNKTPNYLPKFNKDANFFIKEVRNVNVSGRKVPKPITVAYAATRTQAEKYIAGLKKFDDEVGEVRNLQVTEDKMDLTLETGDIVRASGGLIRGKRSREGLDYAGDFGGGRADSFESLQRAIGLTADRIAMSRWRMSAREEWMNSARLHVQELPSDWIAARERVATASMSASQRTKLMNAHDQVSGMSMIPTKSEQRLKGAFISAARALDKIDKAPFQRASSFFYNVKDKSPINLLKSVTFNLTLGAFSMVQIPVQAAGALVAVAINPVYAAKAMDRWLIASALDLGTDLKVVQQTGAILGKRMGLSKDKVKSLQLDYEFWRSSGMKEAVVRGNADAASLMNGLPIDSGLARRGFSKLVEAGQTPYRMGELANMRISFFTALEREKDVAGKAFKYDDATMQRVLARAEDTRLNMNAANKAAFQKGIWSLPTQFKQIYTKYLEAVAGRQFTGPEKLRLLSVQAAAFGAAGVPVLNHFSNEVMKWTGISEDADAETLSLIQRGSIGWMLNDYYNVDAAFSGRLTVSADILEELKKIAVDGRTPMLEIAAGASASPLKHGVGFIENIIMAGNMVYDAEELDAATLAGAVEISLEGLAKMSSSGRSALAARDMHYGWVRNSDGIPIYQVDTDKKDILFRAVGFGSQEKMDMYEQSRINLSIEEERKGRADQYVAAWFTLAHGLQEDDPKKVRMSQIALSMINSQLDQYPVEESLRIREKVLDRINDPNDKMGQVINKAIEIFYTDSINAYNSSVPTVRKEIEELDEIGAEILRQENK